VDRQATIGILLAHTLIALMIGGLTLASRVLLGVSSLVGYWRVVSAATGGAQQRGDAVPLFGGQRGKESTMVRTCSASTAAARSGIAGSLMLAGKPCAGDLSELAASISGPVAVGRACLALPCVFVVLSRCFERFVFSVR
jgi:hypothetical protein